MFFKGALFGQSDYNQTTEFGQKKGLWVEHFENGKLKEIKEYVPTERKGLTKNEAFDYNLPENYDTVFYSERLVGLEEYEYFENWELRRIKRNNKSYLYGKNKDLEIDLKYDRFYFKNRVGDTIMLEIEIFNNSSNEVQLESSGIQDVILIDKYVILQPQLKNIIKVELVIQKEQNHYSLELKNNDYFIVFPIITNGYELTTSEIVNGNIVSVSRNFIYFREERETILKIFEKDKSTEKMTISLSKEMTRVNLSSLEKGDYWFCVIDFSSNNKYCCEAILTE